MSVSIVMPNYNNAAFIRQWLEPLIADPGVSEILIYDNGSTDGSPETIESYQSPKIRLIRGRGNLGATLGRHEAVKACSNDLICYVDGDDWLEEGAVQKAVDCLHRDDLDVALFQCFDVDADGSNPRVTVPTPDAPIDGRTACTLTMGGWSIHIWGVIRKSLYEKAWDGFSAHGFLADEVLTRRILLNARRVGPSPGKMFYRRVPKTYDAQKLIDWCRTSVRALALAVDANLDDRAVRLQRRMTVRSLFGLWRRALFGKMSAAKVTSLLDEYFAIDAQWNITDAPWYAVDRLLRISLPLLLR